MDFILYRLWICQNSGALVYVSPQKMSTQNVYPQCFLPQNVSPQNVSFLKRLPTQNVSHYKVFPVLNSTKCLLILSSIKIKLKKQSFCGKLLISSYFVNGNLTGNILGHDTFCVRKNFLRKR